MRVPCTLRRLARRAAAPILLPFLLVALAGPSAWPAAEGTPKIVRVIIDGNQRISTEAVVHLMTVKEGDPYDETVLKEEFKRIWARGLFSDLSIESRDIEGGKAVIVHVKEKPVVNSLKYDQSKVIAETQIEDALKNRNAQVAIGEPVDYNALKKAEEAIKTLLNQKGYLDAEVHAETKDTGNGNLEVSFKIQEGAKTRIRSIKFTGNKVYSSRRLKKTLKNTREHGWFTRIKQRDIYHPLKYDTDLREIENLYNDNGYIDVNLPPADVKTVEETTSKKQGKSRKWVAIEQKVVEGGQYKVGEISVSGNTVFPSEELVRLVPLRKGQILNESLVKSGLSVIDAKYGQKGYFYISTNRLIDRHPDGTADITVKINEDKQYYLDRVEFAGNNTTRDFVLRREIPVKEGDLFDLTQFRLGLRRVSQLGYFQLSGEPTITPVEGTNKLKVTVAGTEPRRSELQIGGGYSGLDGGFFASSYSTRNFLGRGDLVTVNAQIGAIASRYQLSFTEPYFLDKPITAGFSIYRRDTSYVGFTTSGNGGSVTFGRRLGNFQNASLTLLHETTYYTPSTGISSTTTINSLRPFYSYDTRNNFYRPSRGVQFFASGEYAGGVLSGQASFIKPQVEVQYYLPAIRNTFIAFHAEAGYVAPLTGELLPTYERFFLGGERSLRNYSTRSVGPEGRICRFGVRDAIQTQRNSAGMIDDSECPSPPRGLYNTKQTLSDPSRVIGGNRMGFVNVEYVVPLSQPVDFVVYLDAGNAFAEWEPFRLADFRGDAGVELRFFLPVFGAPLRLIYGQTFNTTGNEDTKSFLFSIGTTF